MWRLTITACLGLVFLLLQQHSGPQKFHVFFVSMNINEFKKNHFRPIHACVGSGDTKSPRAFNPNPIDLAKPLRGQKSDTETGGTDGSNRQPNYWARAGAGFGAHPTHRDGDMEAQNGLRSTCTIPPIQTL